MKFSDYARKDAVQLLTWAAQQGNARAEALAQQLTQGKGSRAALSDVLSGQDWGDLSTSNKRVVAQLKNYLRALSKDPQALYATDKRTQALSAATKDQGRQSLLLRASVADEYAPRVSAMSAKERGQALEAWCKQR